MARVALFDMDRTIVRKDTASLYIRYQRDIGEASLFDLLRVSYWVTQYTFGLLNIQDVAVRVLRSLEGISEKDMIVRCDDWFTRYVEPHVMDGARRAVEEHHKQGDIVAIVTGATPYAARPLARLLGIEHVVSSALEIDEKGIFTGRPVEPFCYGEGKITRTQKLADELGFDLRKAMFYSDSYTDMPLLEYVAEPIAVNPDPRLARIAKQKKWRVERW